MPGPTTREEFKSYCLRRLGSDVLQINVSDAQLEDRIDDALQYWNEFHADGAVELYLQHQITSTDIANEYIPLGNEISYVSHVYPIDQRHGIANFFDIEYQLHLNDLFNLSFSGGLSTYVQTRSYLDMLNDVFHGRNHYQYSRYDQKLYININWETEVYEGDYIIVKCWRFVDPETAAKAYNDRWLKAYGTALIQKQWGLNLSKFDGVELLGGVTMNGERIYQQAEDEIEKLEEEMMSRYQDPIDFFVA